MGLKSVIIGGLVYDQLAFKCNRCDEHLFKSKITFDEDEGLDSRVLEKAIEESNGCPLTGMLDGHIIRHFK